ncbi:unnamed protein product [Leptosia nina]|uniref:Uncharacterized protein n=1 Tax=Leptosia nina TaxID=320188 RepID=A0AAV1JRU2_9NEOP
MRVTLFVVASLALLAACACAPNGDVIQHIPKHEATQSNTKDGAVSGAVDAGVGSKPVEVSRERRDIGDQESHLIPSDNEVSDFGESSLDGRGRIKILPAFLG